MISVISTSNEVSSLLHNSSALHNPSSSSSFHMHRVQPKIHPKRDESVVEVRKGKRDALSAKNNYLPRKIEGKYNADEVRTLKASLKKNDSACVAFSCFGLAFAWLESEIFYGQGNQSNFSCQVLRSIVTSSCFILFFFIFNHYRLRIEILKSLRLIYKGTTFFDSNLFKYFLFESFFCWIHMPPGVDIDVPMDFLGNNYSISLDALISVVMLGRFYIFLRLFDHYTIWTSERALRVCRLMGFQPDTIFAVKALLKYKAIFMVSLSIGISTFFFALLVRTFERDGNELFNFRVIWNCCWCVIVTMATIGYGDIYPVTMLGRFVIIVACIWGVFLLSMFVVTLNNITQLTKEESHAYEEIIRRDKIKNTLKKDAMKIIQLLLKLNLKKNKNLIKKKMFIRLDLLGLIKRFKIKRNNMNNESKNINDQLEEIHMAVDDEMNEFALLCLPIDEAIPHVEEAQKMQGIINEKTVRMFENSKRIHTLLMSLHKGKKINNVVCLNDVKPLYDYKGNLKAATLVAVDSTENINVIKP